jgi:hypothetical protein
MALSSLNSFKSPFLAIIINPSFPCGSFVAAVKFYLAVESLPHYVCGSLVSGSPSLTVSGSHHPSNCPSATKEAK